MRFLIYMLLEYTKKIVMNNLVENCIALYQPISEKKLVIYDMNDCKKWLVFQSDFDLFVSIFSNRSAELSNDRLFSIRLLLIDITHIIQNIEYYHHIDGYDSDDPSDSVFDSYFTNLTKKMNSLLSVIRDKKYLVGSREKFFSSPSLFLQKIYDFFFEFSDNDINKNRIFIDI